MDVYQAPVFAENAADACNDNAMQDIATTLALIAESRDNWRDIVTLRSGRKP